MISLNGKNGTANIRTSVFDNDTISQVIGILNSPIFKGSKVEIMPDCHAGAGCVVGTTMTLTEKVCPNIVGVDIGCGMLVANLCKVDIDFPKFDAVVHNVPSGFAINTNLSNIDYNKSQALIEKLFCFKELRNKDQLIMSLGSLGGGNHFIELDKDTDDNIYLVIHSGSRSLGQQVCNFYQNLAIKKLNEGHLEKVSKDLAYLTGDSLNAYFHDMELCQQFASFNRITMANNILENYFGSQTNIKIQNHKFVLYKDNKKYDTVFETIHNYINFNDRILRKGAVSAHDGEILIIPINMKDGALICKGKGNLDWNQSAPHGAGRLLSRSEAKTLIDLEEYKHQMQGIYSTTIARSTLDESPMAYKPIESIIDNIKDTVEIIKIIKPIYNFKAAE